MSLLAKSDKVVHHFFSKRNSIPLLIKDFTNIFETYFFFNGKNIFYVSNIQWENELICLAPVLPFRTVFLPQLKLNLYLRLSYSFIYFDNYRLPKVEKKSFKYYLWKFWNIPCENFEILLLDMLKNYLWKCWSTACGNVEVLLEISLLEMLNITRSNV